MAHCLSTWSLKTVSPSFRVSWNQSRQVTLQKHRGKDPFARTWRSLPFSYAEIITSHECDLIRKSTNWRLRGKTNKEVKGWTHINQSWKEHLFWWYREDGYLFPVQLWKYCRSKRLYCQLSSLKRKINYIYKCMYLMSNNTQNCSVITISGSLRWCKHKSRLKYLFIHKPVLIMNWCANTIQAKVKSYVQALILHRSPAIIKFTFISRLFRLCWITIKHLVC